MGVKIYRVKSWTEGWSIWDRVRIYGSDQIIHTNKHSGVNMFLSTLPPTSRYCRGKDVWCWTMSDQSPEQVLNGEEIMRVDKSI